MSEKVFKASNGIELTWDQYGVLVWRFAGPNEWFYAGKFLIKNGTLTEALREMFRAEI